ncbi:MAG: hypothetical protein SWY16_08200 [Cyanobacteriota bacterium]|nr:hypothetical protein [Cyanobacteriota bacterium]
MTLKTSFPLWLSPISIGAGIILVNVSNMTIPYTPPDASLNTLLTGELVVPAQVPLPGAKLIKGLGFGAVGLGLAQLAGYAFIGQPKTSKPETPLALLEEPPTVAAAPPPPPPRTSTPTPVVVAPPAASSSPPSALLPLGIVGDIVETLTSSRSPQHVAIASGSRGGKSYTLRGIIWGIEQVDPGAIVRVVDPDRASTGWLGLEKIPGCVMSAHQSLQPVIEAIDEAIALLDRAIANPNRPGKAYFIFDEWNEILDRARQLDANMSGTPDWKPLYPDLLYKMGRLVLQGLEHGIRLVLTVRSCRCEEFGFPPQFSGAFAIAALARQGRYEMFSNLLESAHLVPDVDRRGQLADRAREVIERSQSVKCPLLMTGGGEGRVEEVPDLEWLDWVDLSAFSGAIPTQKPPEGSEQTIDIPIDRTWEPAPTGNTSLPEVKSAAPTAPEPEPIEQEYTLSRETFEIDLPEALEADLFDRVHEAVARGETSASRLIESVLKRTPSPKYRTSEKPGAKYLPRQSDSTDLEK